MSLEDVWDGVDRTKPKYYGKSRAMSRCPPQIAHHVKAWNRTRVSRVTDRE
jgi:hypothetical protein